MKPITTKAEALVYLNVLLEDFVMLESGEWVPDHDSCDASMDMLEAVITFLKEMK